MSRASAEFDVVILGGGLSGLSLAHRAVRKGRKVLVVEKAGQAGGCVRSARGEIASDGQDPFWAELGPHTCYNSYVSLISLLEELQLVDRLLGREKLSFFLLSDGKLRSIPSQLGIPELLRSAPRLLTTPREGQTIRSFYSRIVGSRNYDRVFEPLFNAVACQDTRDFGLDYLFKKRPTRRKDIRRSFTLAGGLQTLIDAMAATPGLSLKTGQEAVAITRDSDGCQVRLADGSLHTGRVLAMATPPADAARLLAGCFPEVAQRLGQIRMNRVYSVGVALPSDQVALPRLAGIVSPGDSFYSVVARDVVPHPTYRAFTFHFKENDLNANMRRIEEVLGVGERAFLRVDVKENEVPALGVNHADLVRQLDRLLEGSNLLVTGNYLLGLSLEDCVARSFSEAAKLERLFA